MLVTGVLAGLETLLSEEAGGTRYIHARRLKEEDIQNVQHQAYYDEDGNHAGYKVIRLDAG